MLEVFAKLRHKGKPHLMLVLPDGSRSYIPVAWTDFSAKQSDSTPNASLIASASDLLRLHQRVDSLLRRIETDLATKQNSSTQESPHAAATTRTVERRASSDSTGLSTTHVSATEQSGRPSGPTHSQTGPGSSCFLNSTQTS
jgi:uncharacterized phage protein gp47/JayE